MPITKLQAALLKKGMSFGTEALATYIQSMSDEHGSLVAQGYDVPNIGFDDLLEEFMFL